MTDANREELKQLKAQQWEEYLQRILIEGKFGQGKNGYDLNCIQARRADTSVAWINSIFLLMSLLILLRIFCLLGKRAIKIARTVLLSLEKALAFHRDLYRAAGSDAPLANKQISDNDTTDQL